jgi:hypothetical protein
MTAIPRPTAATSGWPLSEPADMLEKLRREIKRLVRDEGFMNKTNALHHAFNAATTAILLIDWVWRSGGRDNAALRTSCGLPVPRPALSPQEEKTEFRAFRSAVIQQCPPLGDCLDARDLLQHFELDNHARKPPEIAVSAAVQYPQAVRSRMLDNPDSDATIYHSNFTATCSVKWRTKDQATGQIINLAARDVLNEIVSFWERFFDSHGIPRQ